MPKRYEFRGRKKWRWPHRLVRCPMCGAEESFCVKDEQCRECGYGASNVVAGWRLADLENFTLDNYQRANRSERRDA